MSHHQHIFIVQIPEGLKPSHLSLPCSSSTPLPSEVKYSASLVRGLGYIHLSLGAVTFMLGILGNWVEPETCWAGSGVWGGLTALTCGLTGLLAYKLWYKNFSIMMFLVASMTSVVIHILAVILTIYAIVTRHENYHYLMEEAKKYPWLHQHNVEEKEHQLTLSISANQLVGFIFELVLSMWSTHIGWQGVHAEEFTTLRKDAGIADRESMPCRNQQVPISAIYQLLQAHPEMMVLKSKGNYFESPWEMGERHLHLTRGIDRSKSPSSYNGDVPDTSSPRSCGRGSPASSSSETVVMVPVPPLAKSSLSETSFKQNIKKSHSDKNQDTYKCLSEDEFEIRSPKVLVPNTDEGNGLQIKNDSKESERDGVKDRSESGTENITTITESALTDITKHDTDSKTGVPNANEDFLNGKAKIVSDKETKGENNRKVQTCRPCDSTEDNEKTDGKEKGAGLGMDSERLGSKDPVERTECEPKEASAADRLVHITNLKPPSQFQDH